MTTVMKQSRYDRAVELNIKNALRRIRSGEFGKDDVATTVATYEGLTLKEAKHKLGVKKDDSSYDEQVNAIVSEATVAMKKARKKVKR